MQNILNIQNNFQFHTFIQKESSVKNITNVRNAFSQVKQMGPFFSHTKKKNIEIKEGKCIVCTKDSVFCHTVREHIAIPRKVQQEQLHETPLRNTKQFKLEYRLLTQLWLQISHFDIKYFYINTWSTTLLITNFKLKQNVEFSTFPLFLVSFFLSLFLCSLVLFHDFICLYIVTAWFSFLVWIDILYNISASGNNQQPLNNTF